MHNYILLKISSNPDWFDIYIASLSEIGFDMFEEKDSELLAYAKEESFKQTDLDTYFLSHRNLPVPEYTTELIPYQNWNAEWESNYEPVWIDDQTNILAPFHPKELKVKDSILIQPQMSFGTGHHPTTFGMMKNMQSIDFKDKSVLDFGCGTGVLAIYAKMQGASKITAIDYDKQCVINTEENLLLNNITDISVYQGDIHITKGNVYDIILANITRNTILEYISEISSQLKMEGILICSGLYLTQLCDIQDAAKQNQLDFVSVIEKDSWVSAIFRKL